MDPTDSPPPAELPPRSQQRRRFLKSLTAATGTLSAMVPLVPVRGEPQNEEQGADVVIIGGGLGGCAASLAALRLGLRVVMTEPAEWIGGQLTSQGVPPDEHRWIEQRGAPKSYRELRKRIRSYYRPHYPLAPEFRDQVHLDPGGGSVSRLCHEPRVAHAVLRAWLAPYCSSRRLSLLTGYAPVSADVDGDRIRAVQVRSLRSGKLRVLQGSYFLDATELGDLLPLTGTEFVTGAESRADTGELHAAEEANPANQQAFTVCLAVDYLEQQDHTIDRPQDYDFWRRYTPQLSPPWPGRLLDFTYTHPRSGKPKTLGFHPSQSTPAGVLNLWRYRRIAAARQFLPGHYDSDISLLNWPQNDYLLGNLVGVSASQREQHIQQAKQLSLSLLYWLQTEAPRDDGKEGFPGLRLRPDIMGTEDGLAQYPYVRESRRIRGLFTIREEHVGRENRALATGQPAERVRAADFFDSVGVGSYPIDLHPSTGGDNYIDFASLPFQIPLGALIPQRVQNLLPAAKNIATTHITTGCYRLHPVEWGIGEAAGCLVRFAIDQHLPPAGVRQAGQQLQDFQSLLQRQGIETRWDNG